MQPRRGPWGTIAIIAYVGSLVLPAVAFHCGGAPGILCLLLGWFDFPPWSANLALLTAAILRTRGKHRCALALALLAIALGLTTLRHIVHGDLELGVGFYFWIASMVAVAIASSISIVDREPIARAQALADNSLRT